MRDLVEFIVEASVEDQTFDDPWAEASYLVKSTGWKLLRDYI